MSYKIHRENAPRTIGCGLLTVSDSRTDKTDESGKSITEKLINGGHKVHFYAIIKNDPDAIRTRIYGLLKQADIQVIITLGGTGAGTRDVTVETVIPLLDKLLPGFGELFRSLSYQEIGTAAIMSRAIAGVIQGKVIFCLPGSPAAINLALDQIILPEMGHLVWEANR